MVRASTVVVAALAIVPVLAVPLTEEIPQDVVARSVEEPVADLEARFKFGRFIKGFAKKAIRTAVPGAGLFIREVGDESFLDARDLDVVEEAEDLSLREPIKAGGAVKAASAVRHRASKVGGARKGPGSKRTPSGKGGFGKGKGKKGPGSKRTRSGKGGIGKGKGQGGRKHSQRPGTRRPSSSRPRPRSLDVFEDEPLEAREALDLESSLVDLIERGYLEVIEDVETREPKFRLGHIVKKISGAAGKFGQIAGKVAGVASALGAREFEDGDFLEEREFDEEFEARAEESLDELD
jgi:hypothetical protein